MNTILSIFDTTGEWSAPYFDDGAEVIACDMKNPTPIDVREFSTTWFLERLELELVDGILLAPPCTDFTNSGAQYWPAKDDDGRTTASVELALQGLRAVELWRPDFWALENPVGRLSKLVPALGKPRLIFDPCDFAGWLDITPAELEQLDELRARNGRGEFTAEEIALVWRTNAYTKRTCLWGNYEMPAKRRIEPVRVCAQGSPLQRLGGKSEATKAARSVTPAGFARAFYAANNWHDGADIMAARRAALYALTVLERDASDEDIAAAVADEMGADAFTPAVARYFRAL